MVSLYFPKKMVIFYSYVSHYQRVTNQMASWIRPLVTTRSLTNRQVLSGTRPSLGKDLLSYGGFSWKPRKMISTWWLFHIYTDVYCIYIYLYTHYVYIYIYVHIHIYNLIYIYICVWLYIVLVYPAVDEDGRLLEVLNQLYNFSCQHLGWISASWPCVKCQHGGRTLETPNWMALLAREHPLWMEAKLAKAFVKGGFSLAPFDYGRVYYEGKGPTFAPFGRRWNCTRAAEVSFRAQFLCETLFWRPGWMRPSGFRRILRPTWKLNLGRSTISIW